MAVSSSVQLLSIRRVFEALDYVCLCKIGVFTSLACCSPAAKGFYLVLSAAGQARRPSVHYDACRDPGRALWRCSEHSTSLNWLFLSRGCVPSR